MPAHRTEMIPQKMPWMARIAPDGRLPVMIQMSGYMLTWEKRQISTICLYIGKPHMQSHMKSSFQMMKKTGLQYIQREKQLNREKLQG